MKIEKTLQVSTEALYQQFLKSIQTDYKEAMNKNCSVHDLKTGFTYKKQLRSKMGAVGSVQVSILELTTNKAYHCAFKNAQGTTTLQYRLEPIAEKVVRVIYTEAFEANKKSYDFNYSLLSFFYRRGSRKKVLRMLDSLEAYIIQQGE